MPVGRVSAPLSVQGGAHQLLAVGRREVDSPVGFEVLPAQKKQLISNLLFKWANMENKIRNKFSNKCMI